VPIPLWIGQRIRERWRDPGPQEARGILGPRVAGGERSHHPVEAAGTPRDPAYFPFGGREEGPRGIVRSLVGQRTVHVDRDGEFGGEKVVADLDISAGISTSRSWRGASSRRRKEAGSRRTRDGEPREDGTATSPESPRFPVRESSGSGRPPCRTAASRGGRSGRRRTSGRTGSASPSRGEPLRVSTLGTLTVDSAGPAIELAVSAAGEDVEATMMCLSGKKVS